MIDRIGPNKKDLLTMKQLQNTLHIVHKNFMVLYDVFVGLNNSTE